MEPGKMESGEKLGKMEPAEILGAEEGAYANSGQRWCRHGISSRAEDTRAGQKGPFDGAGDLPSFKAGVVDSTHSS